MSSDKKRLTCNEILNVREFSECSNAGHYGSNFFYCYHTIGAYLMNDTKPFFFPILSHLGLYNSIYYFFN